MKTTPEFDLYIHQLKEYRDALEVVAKGPPLPSPAARVILPEWQPKSPPQSRL